MHEVTERILAFNTPRNPKIVRYKYKFMRENLFRFYRGTCHLFYEDLHQVQDLPPSPLAWICGDLHLENFGSFRSGNGQIYFDLNDFDEAVLAPVSWELLRFLTSIFIGFESLGIDEKKAIKMARLYLKSYVCTLYNGKAEYIEPVTAHGIVRDFLKAAGRKKQKDILTRKTILTKTERQILLDNPKHFKIRDDLKKDLVRHINEWLKNDSNSPYNYQVIDAIFRLAGTGSVGYNRFAFLLKTLNKTGDKYFLLEMKEASPSSLVPYLDIPQPQWRSEADRIISIQKRMQNRCPALLSTTRFQGKHFTMQEMQPTKDSIDFKLLKNQYREMIRVIDSMAILTASSQLRSSGHAGSAITDALQGFAGEDHWQDYLLDYALSYSRKIQRDYTEFCEDIGVDKQPTVMFPNEAASEQAAENMVKELKH